MTQPIGRVMRLVAREAMVETIHEYAEPLAWLARKFAGLARRLQRRDLKQEFEQVRTLLLRVTEEMTRRQVHALLLYYGVEPNAEDMSLEEIAALTGVSAAELRDLREIVFERLRSYPEATRVLSLKRAWGR